MPSTTLLSELRNRIKDARYSQRAFGLGVTEDAVTSAVAEVTNGRLMVTVAGGAAPSIDLDLTHPRYDTVGKLFLALERTPGYSISKDEDISEDHTSVDLESFGPIDVKSVQIDLKHRLFSDQELEDILRRAVQRHNPSMAVSGLPGGETEFVLQLAHSLVLGVQAMDAVKRKGLDADVSTLLQLSERFESQYASDVKRLARAIQLPKESDPNTMREGDVVLGQLHRRSLRTGYISPISQNLPPDPPIFITPGVIDIEDESVRLTWERARDHDFYSIELWMDTQAEVVRGTTQRPSTSKRVFDSYGGGRNSGSSSTFLQEAGQTARSGFVTGLEPSTEYFFRIFTTDLNRESMASDVVQVTTKPLRVRFAENSYVSRTSGAAGVTVTVTFDTTKGAYTSNCTFKIGGKVVTATILSAYSITFVVPSFTQLGPKDLTVTSLTGLYDVKPSAFTVL